MHIRHECAGVFLEERFVPKFSQPIRGQYKATLRRASPLSQKPLSSRPQKFGGLFNAARKTFDFILA
jgi:hypothetical protein